MAHQTIKHGGDSVVRARATKSKSQHFLDNDQFKQWISDHIDERNKAIVENRPLPKIPENIGKAFLQIATALSKKPYFINYSWIDDAINDGVLQCCACVHKFDPTIGTSAFAYFTQVCYYEFIGKITAEKKQRIGKAGYIQNLGIMFDDMNTQDHDLDETYTNAWTELMQLQNMDIEVAKRKKKTEENDPEPEPFDMFDL